MLNIDNTGFGSEYIFVPQNRHFTLTHTPYLETVELFKIGEGLMIKCKCVIKSNGKDIIIPNNFDIGSEILIVYRYELGNFTIVSSNWDGKIETITVKTENKFKREDKQMTKSDLKTGMRVILRNGREYTVALNTCYGDLLLSDDGTYCDMNYNDDLLYYGYCSLDITDIYKPTKTNHMNSKNRWEPIWRRNLVDEISLQEAVDMLKKVTGKNIKIVIQ